LLTKRSCRHLWLPGSDERQRSNESCQLSRSQQSLAKTELSKWGKAYGAYLDAGGSIDEIIEVSEAGILDSDTPWDDLPELEQFLEDNVDCSLSPDLPENWSLQNFVSIADTNPAAAEFPFGIKDHSDNEEGGWKTDKDGAVSRYTWKGPWH
jgi:hypothetical protein